MKRTLGQIFMYVVAAIFLGYHLMPVFSFARGQVAQLLTSDKKQQEIVDNAICTPSDSQYLVLTEASPLQPLYREISYVDPATQPLEGENLITDPSFATRGVSWQKNTFGENNAQFEIVGGYDDAYAARIIMWNRKSGDGKWLSNAVAVKPAERVIVEHRYKSDTYSDVIADITQSDGGHVYIQLGKGEPTNGKWLKLRYEIVIPIHAEQIAVGHALTENGTLDVDNWRLVKTELPQLERGLVSLTFDDGWESIYTNGLPLFSKYNVKTTQYVVSGVIGDKAYLKPDQLKKFVEAGHDIGSHSAQHEDLSTIGEDGVRSSLASSRDVLNDYYGMSVFDFAAPYGRTNAQSEALIKSCYRSHRGTDTGYNTAQFDRYNLKVMNVELTTKPEEIAAAVRFAKENKLWLILVYHEVSDQSESAYAANLKDLERTLQILNEEQIPVVTISEGLRETMPQVEAQFTKR